MNERAPQNDSSPFDKMQKAVDIVNSSPHPANKIAATLFGRGRNDAPFSLSRTNFWPPSIREKLGTECRIGNSSGTIHAETAVLLTASFTDGSCLCVTDPVCPNCAKNAAEAGIRALYIDHKGFAKDFAARRGAAFDSMSMQICARAGISVYELRRKEKTLVPILESPADYTPVQDHPLEREAIADAAPETFFRLIPACREKFSGHPFALALARDDRGAPSYMAARAHLSPGFSESRDPEATAAMHGKYTFVLEPINRLLMNAPRFGLKLLDGFVFSSTVPTAREQVNMAGAGLHTLYVGDTSAARDDSARAAMKTMSAAGVLKFIPATAAAEA